MDGTYKINKYSYPLYMILIQDNLGRGRAIFHAFLRSETADMMNSLMTSFCKMMEDVSKTKTVMLDKDQNEIQAVRTALPTATIPTSLSERFSSANVHLPLVKRRGRPKESKTLGRFNNSKGGQKRKRSSKGIERQKKARKE